MCIWGLGAAAFASRTPMPPFNPATHISQSGEYSLHIIPSDSKGRWSAKYEMKGKGKILWSEERPYTLWEARVSNRGETAGYSYSQGLEGWGKPGERGKGEMWIVILNPDGGTRWLEKHPRKGSFFLDTDPDPKAAGLILDESNDRVAFRIADPDVNSALESWWIYQLSTGAPLLHVQPRTLMANREARFWIRSAQPIAGTPLLLLHWYRYRNPPVENGARFSVVDWEARLIWFLDFPQDYMVESDESKQDALHRELYQKGAILRTDQSGRFEVRSYREGKRLSFSVEKQPDGQWKVAEIARANYSEEPSTKSGLLESSAQSPDSLASETLPAGQLNFLGQIVLRTGEEATSSSSPIHNIVDFSFNDKGNIAFLRRGNRETSPTLVLITQDGKLLGELPLDGNTRWQWVRCASASRFLVIGSRGSRGQKDEAAEAWWADFDSGSTTRIEPFDTCGIRGADVFPGGRFVVVVSRSQHHAVIEELIGFDPKGNRLWTVSEGGNITESSLFSPQDVTITESGQVAVLSGIRNRIQLFDKDGRFQKCINLQETSGRKFRYPSHIARDREGGFLVCDFQYLRLNSQGAIQKVLPLQYPDGYEFRGRAVHLSPQGKLWASDDERLMRLEETGRAAAGAILGRIAEKIEFGFPESMSLTVDHSGRIYVIESRTHSIFVFNSEGDLLRILRPLPGDVSGTVSFRRLSVAESGDVYLSDGFDSPSLYLHFSPEGKRIGKVNLDPPEGFRNGYFHPCGENRWMPMFDTVALVSPSNQVLTTVRKQGDGNWFGQLGEIDSAPDGSLAVLSQGGVSFLFAPGRASRFCTETRMAWRLPTTGFRRPLDRSCRKRHRPLQRLRQTHHAFSLTQRRISDSVPAKGWTRTLALSLRRKRTPTICASRWRRIGRV